VAIVENGEIAGYNVLVGGGMGNDARQRQHLPPPRPPDLLRAGARGGVSTAEAVVRLFRDHGNRADRKARALKYLVHDWGVEKFRQVPVRVHRRPAGGAAPGRGP